MANLPDTLDDLAELISLAEQSTKGRTFDDLSANREAYDALTYRLSMIGETCKNCPTISRTATPIFRGNR